MTELEQQVEELKTQVEDSQPCPTAPADHRERQFEEAVRENAALRRLLNAMGIDEHCQRRYLESSAKRDAVDLILGQRDREGCKGPLSLEHSTEPENNVRSHAVATMQQSNYSPRNPTDMVLGYGGMDNLNVDPLQLDFNAHSSGLYSISNDVSSYFGRWLIDSSNYADLRTGAIESVESTLDPQTSQPEALLSQELRTSPQLSSGVGWDIQNPTTGCCVMDAAVPLSDSESTTVCSLALSMVFQHNKKQLTLIELNEKLRFGFRKALKPFQECRVENRILFEVLAEIST